MWRAAPPSSERSRRRRLAQKQGEGTVVDGLAQSVYLSLGSNLGDRESNLRAALDELRGIVQVGTVSSLYETDPWGVADQPAFLNLVATGVTQLPAHDLLQSLKGIERSVGRTPTYRWGPRVVDIDILMYDRLQIQTPDLTVPHPRMHERAFVLVPLAEVAPDLVHPVLGKSIAELLDSTGRDGVRRILD
jgi:2-amino-4-hydroxy-6-hydroxymethyldihydropteridine diphosphokinase